MAMRPELKTIKDAIKAAPKQYIKLERPIMIKAGTEWKHSVWFGSNSANIYGKFKRNCKIKAITTDDHGCKTLPRAVLSAQASIENISDKAGHLCSNDVFLAALDTGILKQIADQIKA